MSHMEGKPWFCLILENTFLRNYLFWTYYPWVSANRIVPICDSGLFILLWWFDSFKILPLFPLTNHLTFRFQLMHRAERFSSRGSSKLASCCSSPLPTLRSVQGCTYLPIWNQIYSFLARNRDMSCWDLFLWNAVLHNTFYCTSQGDMEIIARSWFSTYLQFGIWHTEGLQSWGIKTAHLQHNRLALALALSASRGLVFTSTFSS